MNTNYFRRLTLWIVGSLALSVVLAAGGAAAASAPSTAAASMHHATVARYVTSSSLRASSDYVVLPGYTYVGWTPTYAGCLLAGDARYPEEFECLLSSITPYTYTLYVALPDPYYAPQGYTYVGGFRTYGGCLAAGDARYPHKFECLFRNPYSYLYRKHKK